MSWTAQKFRRHITCLCICAWAHWISRNSREVDHGFNSFIIIISMILALYWCYGLIIRLISMGYFFPPFSFFSTQIRRTSGLMWPPSWPVVSLSWCFWLALDFSSTKWSVGNTSRNQPRSTTLWEATSPMSTAKTLVSRSCDVIKPCDRFHPMGG